MFSRGLALLTFCSIFLLVQTSPSPNPLLSPRQSTFNPPAQCQSECAVVIERIDNCADLACLCTPDDSEIYAHCLDCIVATGNTADAQQQGQQDYDSFQNECSAGGFTIPSVKISANSASAGRAVYGTSIVISAGILSAFLSM